MFYYPTCTKKLSFYALFFIILFSLQQTLATINNVDEIKETKSIARLCIKGTVGFLALFLFYKHAEPTLISYAHGDLALENAIKETLKCLVIAGLITPMKDAGYYIYDNILEPIFDFPADILCS